MQSEDDGLALKALSAATQAVASRSVKTTVSIAEDARPHSLSLGPWVISIGIRRKQPGLS